MLVMGSKHMSIVKCCAAGPSKETTQSRKQSSKLGQY